MEFDFLPNLPKSDLDDRTFKDLVEECMLRIPRYCPEWTNHNPSDPGITLVELFAWLTDQMLLRFNQVPRRQYVAYLELLGIRLQPPAPAHTEVTFYLTRPQSEENRFPPIPISTEVATERTETQAAVVFSTNSPLTVGVPQIRHFLTGTAWEPEPRTLRDRFSNLWRQESDGSWSGRQQPVFQLLPEVGDCFYLVFEPQEALDGNIIRLTITGEPAGSTGIDPERPPRSWEAWDGQAWQSVLLSENDDGTQGFSFDEAGQPTANTLREGDVTLHLPLRWPDTTFANYRGRWVRCIYEQTQDNQAAYSRSPQFTALSACAIGGTAHASQCSIITDELLGESNGNPGQTFSLQSDSILSRNPEQYPLERVMVTPPGGGLPQAWTEVANFAESGPDDRHYLLDSTTGRLQFGPLIRESGQLREGTAFRQSIQRQTLQTQMLPGQMAPSRNGAVINQLDGDRLQSLERQYGAVPSRGSTIRMASYRTGGGTQGNVQAGTIRILKSAVPYVSRVTNYGPARDGADAESLDDAVIRVPSFLRTRERAVTPEDFETLTLQSSRAVARAHCLRKTSQPGVVKLLVVPRVEPSLQTGLAPEQLELSAELNQEIQSFLDERRLLGIDVKLQTPRYVGVSVQAEVIISPEYRHSQAQQLIQQQIEAQLYRFLNPITGGDRGQGWAFGTPVRLADVAPVFQQVMGINYVQTLQLFSLVPTQSPPQEPGQALSQAPTQTPNPIPDQWERHLATDGVIDPGPLGLICSWNAPQLRSGHAISLTV